MSEKSADEIERNDAEKVDAAVKFLEQANVKAALGLIFDVISRAPEHYVREYEVGDTRYIKFWDLEEFTHFVTDPAHPVKQKIVWLSSAYPRALYYLGFTFVKLNEPAKAIQILEKGYALEPHPIFLIERGKALSELKRHEEAMASYEAAFSHEGSVRASVKAVALRGKGFQLIELSRLDDAEQAFNDSLTLDPNNSVARNELAYIEQLRKGGRIAPKQTVKTGGQPVVCAICGERLKDGGKVTNVDGRIVFRCAACAEKLPSSGAGTPGLPAAADAFTVRLMPTEESRRRWWEFWKR